MLSSISPLGEQARHSRWWITNLAYVVGSVIGGTTLGLLSAAVGSLLPVGLRTSAAGWGVVAVLLILGLVLDLRARGGALPSWRRQVDEAWLGRYRGWVYGLGFGLQLGFGLVTIVTSATTYATVLLALWSGNLWAGAILGATFGLVRSLPSLLMYRVRDRADLHRVFRLVERGQPMAAATAQVGLLVGGVILTAAAIMTSRSMGGWG